MRSLKHLAALAVIISVWMSACTYSTTRQIQLNSFQKAVIDTAATKYSFEDIQLQEKTSSGSSGSQKSILIKFINGKNLPLNNDSLNVAGKKLAKAVKKATNIGELIDVYIVRFEASKTDGATTTTNYVDFDYPSSDL